MRDVIYESLVVAEGESEDGNSTSIIVTEERNAFIAWEVESKYPIDGKFLRLFREWSRTEAIEWAVDRSRELRKSLTTGKVAVG